MGQRPEELGDLADEGRFATGDRSDAIASSIALATPHPERCSQIRRRELTSTCLQHSTVDALWFLPDAPQHIEPAGSDRTATLASNDVSRGVCRALARRPRRAASTDGVRARAKRRHGIGGSTRQGPRWGVGGRGAPAPKWGPRSAAERVREAMRRSEATHEWVTEEVSAMPTTEQDSERAKRGWKRSTVPPPLMLFSFLSRLSSFSEKTASLLLLDRGKMLLTKSLSTE